MVHHFMGVFVGREIRDHDNQVRLGNDDYNRYGRYV